MDISKGLFLPYKAFLPCYYKAFSPCYSQERFTSLLVQPHSRPGKSAGIESLLLCELRVRDHWQEGSCSSTAAIDLILLLLLLI